MAYGKAIELFLVNGTADSLILVGSGYNFDLSGCI